MSNRVKPFIKLEPYLILIQNRLRHQKFKVRRDQRTCPLCFNECEDEIHFLFNSDKLPEQHQSFEKKLGKFGIKHFANLMIFLFSNENPGICRILAYIIHRTFQVREKYSQNYDLYFRYMMVMYILVKLS